MLQLYATARKAQQQAAHVTGSNHYSRQSFNHNFLPTTRKVLHKSGALGVELSAELLRVGRPGVPLVCCEVCTHNSKPFPSYDFGRPTP